MDVLKAAQYLVKAVRAPVAISVLVRNPDAKHKGCRILYRDIGDYLSREQKLNRLREWGSIGSIDDWQEIQPDQHHDWIGQRNEAFKTFYPMGSKEAKADKVDNAVFRLYSRGLETTRDVYIYNFSDKACANNAHKMVQSYRDALRDWSASKKSQMDLNMIMKSYSPYIKWDDKLERSLQRGTMIDHLEKYIKKAAYRPFIQQFLYADEMFLHRLGKIPDIFPSDNTDNRAICVPGIGSTKPFSALMVDCMPDLELISKGQCFPRYRFLRKQALSLLEETSGLERVDNISDTALAAFRTHYQDPAISKDAIFAYVYGVLHAPDFRARFAHDLAKSLPRIPFAADFQAFAQAGQALAALHLHYETGPQYPLTPQVTGTGPLFTPRAMGLAGENNSVLVVNDHLRLAGIPPEAHRYQVNGRTPLGWFIDRYRVTTDKHSGIRNDPNAWFADEAAFIAAVGRIVHLSVETVRIVEGLPGALVGGGG